MEIDTKEIKKQFYENGYFIYKDFFKKNEIEKLENLIFSESDKNNYWSYFKDNEIRIRRESLNLLSKSSLIKDFFSSTKIVNLLKELFHNQNPYVYRDAYIGKFKDNRSSFKMHQDSEHWSSVTPHRLISLWIPMVDVSHKNGTLYVVPKSHLLEKMDHRVSFGKFKLPKIANTILHLAAKTSGKPKLKNVISRFIRNIVFKIFDFLSNYSKGIKSAYWKLKDFYVVSDEDSWWEKSIPVEMNKGDILIYHSKTLHGSPANNTDDERKVFIPSFMSEEFNYNGKPITSKEFSFTKI